MDLIRSQHMWPNHNLIVVEGGAFDKTFSKVYEVLKSVQNKMSQYYAKTYKQDFTAVFNHKDCTRYYHEVSQYIEANQRERLHFSRI